MKKHMRVYLLALLLGRGAYAVAQDYIPFPDSNVVWSLSFNASDCILWGDPEQNYQYAYDDDTLINGQSYHRVVRTFSCSACCGGADDGYKGALRNDLATRKVMFVPTWGTEEVVLFDFSLEIGDTLHSFLTDFCSSPVLLSIDTIFTPAGPRRRYVFDESCWYHEFH